MIVCIPKVLKLSLIAIEVDGLSFPAIAALATHYKVEYKLVHRKIRTYLFWNDQ